MWRSKLTEQQMEKMQGIALRTRFIDDFVMNGIQFGIRQIVIVGVGMDCRGIKILDLHLILALRLNLPNDCQVYEIDLEEVLTFKNSILEEAMQDNHLTSILPLSNRHCIGVDLSTPNSPWKTPLLQSGFDITQPSLWIMEGLLMYLSEEDITTLVKTVGELCAPKSRLVAQHGGAPPTQANASTVHKIHQDINAPIRSCYIFDDMKILLSSQKFENTLKITPFEMGDWAVKRLEEAKIDRKDAEGGYYLFTTEKM